MSSAQSEEIEKQRRHEYHTQNHSRNTQDGESQNAEILRELSEIDDLPINPENDRVVGQFLSKLASTSNLSAEEVRSNEWEREFLMLLYLCEYPKPGGLSGEWRGYAHGDISKERDSLDPEKRTELETTVMNSKLALSRSEDGKVIEEGVRNVSESITRDETGDGDSSGGILGRIRS